MEPEHVCDFGQGAKPVKDNAVCLVCGASVMSGFELGIDWSEYEKTPGQSTN